MKAGLSKWTHSVVCYIERPLKKHVRLMNVCLRVRLCLNPLNEENEMSKVGQRKMGYMHARAHTHTHARAHTHSYTVYANDDLSRLSCKLWWGTS